MRILIITQWFQPEPHFKGLGMAQALQAMGHDVEVLTGFPNYPGGKVYPGYKVGLRQKEMMGGIAVTRGYLYPSHNSSGLGRAANYVSFALSSTLFAMFAKKPDVVYVYTPPMTATLPAMALRFLRGVPFVPDIQDLWPDTLAATGMLNNPRALKLIGWWTDFSLRHASRIVVLSEGFRRRLQTRGIKTPIVTIKNWAPAEIKAVADSLTASAPSPSKSFNIVFAGNMGKAQGLDIILHAARYFQDKGNDVLFTMVGGGIEKGPLQENANGENLRNIQFLDQRHPSEMANVFDSADALLVHLRNDPLFEITIPSKTQAYLCIGKPILMGVRGDAAEVVEEAKAGISFQPEDPESLVQAIETLLAMNPEQRRTMGQAGSSYYRQNLDFEIGMKKLESVLVAACKGRDR